MSAKANVTTVKVERVNPFAPKTIQQRCNVFAPSETEMKTGVVAIVNVDLSDIRHALFDWQLDLGSDDAQLMIRENETEAGRIYISSVKGPALYKEWVNGHEKEILDYILSLCVTE